MIAFQNFYVEGNFPREKKIPRDGIKIGGTPFPRK
jgi:hypothetical protein